MSDLTDGLTPGEAQKFDENGNLVLKTYNEMVTDGTISYATDKVNKLLELRKIRDYILNRASWITEFRTNEDHAIILGLMTENERTWDAILYTQYLLWKKTMRDLPQTLNIDNYILSDIIIENKTIFVDCPIDLRLTAIGNL